MARHDFVGREEREGTMKRDFNIRDRVICVSSGVIGEAIRFYFPTACAEQTMVLTDDGRKYHAPTAEWRKLDDI